MTRCPWSESHPLMTPYHDQEWGTPLHDEGKHFEFLLLETMQAGLSWLTILKKREAYRRAFAGFDPRAVADFTPADVERLLAQEPDPEIGSIVRNRKKIEAGVRNAQAFLRVQKEFGSFDAYLWHFTEGRTIEGRWGTQDQIPVTTELSDRVSVDLKKRGFSFVGSTTIYAHLQAVGVVNDHLTSCFRHRELTGTA